MSGNYNSGGHNCTHGKYENVPRVDSYSIYNMIDKLRNASISYRWSLEWCRGKQKYPDISEFLKRGITPYPMRCNVLLAVTAQISR